MNASSRGMDYVYVLEKYMHLFRCRMKCAHSFKSLGNTQLDKQAGSCLNWFLSKAFLTISTILNYIQACLLAFNVFCLVFGLFCVVLFPPSHSISLILEVGLPYRIEMQTCSSAWVLGSKAVDLGPFLFSLKYISMPFIHHFLTE